MSLELADQPRVFTGPSAGFARQLLAAMLAAEAGQAPECSPPVQARLWEQFEPWETRQVRISGTVPPDAPAGQTFMFRVVQHIGPILTGGYTVAVLVA